MQRTLLTLLALLLAALPWAARADDPLPSPVEVLNPETVHLIVEESNAVQACLRKADRQGLTLPEQLWVEFTVHPDGSIRDAAVATLGLPDGEIGQCLPEGIEQQRFPPFASRSAKTIKVPIASSPTRR